MPVAPRRGYQRTVLAVRCKHSVEARQVDAWLAPKGHKGTRAASRAMKSNGSKMTCVVPCPKHSLRSRGKLSRYGVLSWYRTLPFGVSESRFSETAGRLIYRHVCPELGGRQGKSRIRVTSLSGMPEDAVESRVRRPLVDCTAG